MDMAQTAPLVCVLPLPISVTPMVLCAVVMPSQLPASMLWVTLLVQAVVALRAAVTRASPLF